MDLVKKLNPFKRHRTQTQEEMPVLTSSNHSNHTHHQSHQPSSSQRESSSKKKAATEKELVNLNHKIEKLLANLDDGQSEKNFAEDEECVVCLSSRATMKTYPCGHRVVCRKCFVKTIQTAVSERCLPLKCVVCRTKILKLKQVDHKSDERKSRKQSHSNHQHSQQHNHSNNNNNNGYNKRSIYSLPSPYQTIAIASRKHLNPHRQGDHTSVLSSSGIFTTPTISRQTTISSFSRSNSSCAGHQDFSCSSSNFNGSTSNPGTSSRFSSKPSLVQTPSSMTSSGKTTTTPRSGDVQLIRIPPPPAVNRRRGAEKRSLSTSSSSAKNVLRISQDFGRCDTAAAAAAAASVDSDARMTPETSSVRNHFPLFNGSSLFQDQTTSGNPVDLGLSVQVQGQSDVAMISNNSSNSHGLHHNYTYTINLNNFPVTGPFDGNSASSSSNNNNNNINNNNNNNNNNINNLVINKCNICQEQAKYDPSSAVANKISAHQIRGGTCSHHQPPASATPPFVSRPAPTPRLMQPLLIYPAEATVPARDKKWSGMSGWSEDGGPFVSTPPSVFKVFSGKRRSKFSNLYGVD